MEIWEELQADVEKGTRRLLAEYGNRLLTAAGYITQNAADAEDLVFRTFAQVVRKIDTYDGRSSFYSWMYAILINFYRMNLRRKGANALEFPGEMPDVCDIKPDPAEMLALNSTFGEVRKAVGSLPEGLRVPLVLHYYESLGVSEIAGLLGLPVGTVKYRLYEARKRMATRIIQTGFEERASNTGGKSDEGRKRQIR